MSNNRTQPPIPENLRREIELSVEARHNKKEWGGHKHQILCSPNIFDEGTKPPRRIWDKTKTDVHRRIKNTRKWIEHFGRIRNKMGEIVPIRLNHAQRLFLARVLRRWRNGHSARVVILKPRQTGFCYDPSMKILMEDMTWTPIGEVEPGEELVAFDEHAPKVRGSSRKLRRAKVVATKRVEAEAFRVTFTDGRELIVTGPHRHLCRARGGTATKWVKVEDMRPGDHVRSITHSTWDGPGPEDGWMGGLYDGEGHIRAHPNRKGVSIGVCQVAGAIWDRAMCWLRSSGMRFKTYVDDRRAGDSSKLGHKDVHSASIHRISDIMRFAGTTGSTKLLVRDDWWNGRAIPKHRDKPSWAEVASIESVGVREMVDLQTTEGTYVCEGFASHNSTVVELIIFYLTVTATFKRGCVIAHKNSISTKILNIFRTALKFMPYELPTKHRTRYEVVFDDPINGSVDVDSAESDEPGHGDTVQYLHLTEVSRWKDAARKAKGVMQTVPDMPVTLIAWESTANGAEGYFYDLYWLAKDTDNPANRMDAVFVAWFEHAEYTATALSEAERDYIHRTMDQEEVDLLEQRYFVRKRGWVKITMEQLAWRRRAIADKCGGDLEAFHEQYPAYELEAFLSSGRPVFNAQKLIERDRAVRDPVFRGDLIDSDFEPPKEPDTPEGLSALTEKTPAGPHAFHVEQSPPRPEFLNPEVTDEPVAVPEPEEPPIGPDQDPNWQ